jgi:hypothetical protein
VVLTVEEHEHAAADRGFGEGGGVPTPCGRGSKTALMSAGGPLAGGAPPTGVAGGRVLPTWARVAVVGVACLGFLLIIFVRGGPNPGETDAHADTLPATAISHGDLRGAEKDTYVPNPPGYALITSPFVLVLRPWVGAPRWCDDKAIPAILRKAPASLFFRALLSPCADHNRPADRPLWYRSQALLTVLAFLALALGATMLAGAAGLAGTVRELALVVALMALPATTDAVAQSYHPQDLMSVGFAFAGVGLALRRRWVLVGVAFGCAFLCKQFALLPLAAVLAAAPTWRTRAWCVLAAVGVASAAVLPFYLVDPTDTVHALSAVYVAGVNIVKTPTVLGLLSINEQTKLELARDVPVLGVVVLAVACRWWRGDRLLAPEPLVGLVVACYAVRLVFELGFLNYYFLAVGAALLVLDFLFARLPVRSVIWIVATRYGLTAVAPRASPTLTAVVFLVASLGAVAIGVGGVARPALTGTVSRASPSAPSS